MLSGSTKRAPGRVPPQFNPPTKLIPDAHPHPILTILSYLVLGIMDLATTLRMIPRFPLGLLFLAVTSPLDEVSTEVSPRVKKNKKHLTTRPPTFTCVFTFRGWRCVRS